MAVLALPVGAKGKAEDEVVLSGVEVSRNKTVFSINYEISLGAGLRSCEVVLLLSTDAGGTFNRVDRQFLSGDYGKIASSGSKTIEYDFSSDMDYLAGKQIVFKVEVAGKAVDRWEIFAAAQVAVYPHLSYGVMVGSVNRFGWYAKLRSDFSFPSPSYYQTTTDGNFWGTGKSQIFRLNVTAGAMARIGSSIYPYVGAGYGNYGLCWEDAAGNWAGITDYSTSGLSLDAGVVLKFGNLAITAGASNTMFRYTEAEIGVGLFF